MFDQETLDARIKEGEVRHLLPLEAAYGDYLGLLGENEDLTDGPNEATAALDRLDGDRWTRPVMFAGFDELTPLQLEVIGRLAFREKVDVTVAVSHEPGNPALELTARTVGELENLGPEGDVTGETTERPESSPDHDQLLFSVQKRFMRSPAKTDQNPGPREDLKPLQADDALTILTSTGQRNEAEAIAVEIARLIADGVEPDEITVAVDAPARNGRILRDTLARFSIPVTLECETPVEATTTGKAILALLGSAGASDSADDLLVYLRSPIGSVAESGAGDEHRRAVDELERWSRTEGQHSARKLMEWLTVSGGGPPPHWDEIREAIAGGRPIDGIVNEAALAVSLEILKQDQAAAPSALTTAETLAASAISKACAELSGLEGARGIAERFAETLSSGAIKVWIPAAQGAVRIASPYSLRAKRVEHLFYASLQETGLTDPDRPGPFISTDDRQRLGMSERRDPEVQQRYLFYSCLTVPTKRLWLSCRNSDETGKAEHPSPLIGAVEELFARDANDEVIVRRGGRAGSAVTFQPADAPSEQELARALTATPVTGGNRESATAALETELAGRLMARLASAEETEDRTRRLADLSLEPILNALGEAAVMGATDIEAYAGCPYRWFIEKQLSPQPFEPDPDYLSVGNLVHGVLDDLYAAHPGEIPRPATLRAWTSEVPGLVGKRAADRRVKLDQDTAAHAGLRSRAAQTITSYLRREAKRENPSHLPWKLEAGFGTTHSDEPAVDMGGWSLKGKIDRIDLSPETGTGVPRTAVAVDYKTGDVDSRTHHKAKRDRKVQIQLYLHAIWQIWGHQPVAGLYVPIKADPTPKSRGAYDVDQKQEMLDRGVMEKEKTEDFDLFIQEGIEMADQAVVGLMKGLLDHEPATCPDHFDHPAVPDRPAPDGEGDGGN
ncbi:MAG: PD-(D/E)XK nuclease family protein [Thermoleophilia bacterium]|nr:PD-(D/E)XK nuclease family protein [Thermoleophilia bacterium]